MFRRPVNKQAAKKNFNRQASRTKRINIAPPPNRGGYRL